MYGTAKFFPVIVMIATDEKQNSCDSNDYERQNTDQYYSAMNLVADI